MAVEFSWDQVKALSNRLKHEVTFEEAATVFDDPPVALRRDPRHSIGEERRPILGLSAISRL